MLVSIQKGGILLIHTIIIDGLTIFLGDAFDDKMQTSETYIGIQELCSN